MRYPGFVPTINLRLPVLSLTLFAHSYPSQTLPWLKIYQKLFSTHMHNWLLLYICRKNTYQSAVIRSISQCLAPKIRFTFTASETIVCRDGFLALRASGCAGLGNHHTGLGNRHTGVLAYQRKFPFSADPIYIFATKLPAMIT